MAVLYPSLDTIKKLAPQPTEGELHLVELLCKNLNDEYEIFFNPFLDGDRPDVIILKKNYGAIIIEVKDWRITPDRYSIDERNKWKFINPAGKEVEIISPCQQAFKYKQSIYNIHIPLLGEKNFFNRKFYGLIKCFVYYHNKESRCLNDIYERALHKLQKTIDNDAQTKGEKEYHEKIQRRIKRDQWMSFFCTEKLLQKINDRNFFIKSKMFDEEIYSEIKRKLHPSSFIYKQATPLNLDEKQKTLSTSTCGEHVKIKGVSGCGKTTVLAERAVNSILRHQGSTLILSYNLSLKNLIRDKVNASARRKNANPEYIEISNYHRFYLSQATNHNIKIYNTRCPNQYSENIFKGIKKHHLYDTILIDELQDYKLEWIEIVQEFLKKDGEMILFGDLDQNIYKNNPDSYEEKSLIDRKIIGFGKWNLLKKSYRFKGILSDLFLSFRNSFIEQNNLDKKSTETQSSLNINDEFIDYKLMLDHFSIANFIWCSMRERRLIQNDTAVISSRIEDIRRIEFHYRNISNEKTHRAIETEEEFENLKTSGALEEWRRIKKNSFQQNSGLVKFSTIHSFKGLESQNVFYIITKKDTPEIIYTAITRCKKNIFIISLEENSYGDFFLKQSRKL